MKIIGMLGRKGVGKNFVANCIERAFLAARHEMAGHGEGCRSMAEHSQQCSIQVAFADPIKKFSTDVLLLDEKSVYGNDTDKNKPTKYRWEQMPDFVRKDFKDASGPMTHRHVMQVIGTQLCRDIWNKNIWVDAMRHRLDCLVNLGPDTYHGEKKQLDVAIITDVRFPNEQAAIKSWGGVIVKVDGPRGVSADQHESERLIDTIPYDHLILNSVTDTQETITAKVMELVK